MSIMSSLLSALGGSDATSAAASVPATTAVEGKSFLGNMMDKGTSAINSIGNAATAATDAMGITGPSDEELLSQLNDELITLKEEAEFIKSSGGDANMGGYETVEAREADLAENAARTQEVLNKIKELEGKATADNGLEGMLSTAGNSRARTAQIQSAPGVSSGQVDPNALVGAAMSGLNGVLGGAPKTTQQQLIQAQNQAFGGFKV